MKTLIIISFIMIFTSSTFACSICESKCPYEQARAEQQFRWSYQYREVMHAGYADELHLRQQLRNRRRREILDYSHYCGGRYRSYGYEHSLSRSHYSRYGGSLKGGSY